jgi:integrase
VIFAAALGHVTPSSATNARGSRADYRREMDRYLPEDDPLAAMPVEKVTVDAIHDWHIRLQKRGRNSGGRKGFQRVDEEQTLTARRIELDQEPPRINVEEPWKRTDQYGRYERGGPKSLEGNRVVPIDPELAALLRPLVAERRGNEEVFLTGYETVVHYNNVHGRIWRPAVTQAFANDAIPFEPTIHDLRHAHAA